MLAGGGCRAHACRVGRPPDGFTTHCATAAADVHALLLHCAPRTCCMPTDQGTSSWWRCPCLQLLAQLPPVLAGRGRAGAGRWGAALTGNHCRSLAVLAPAASTGQLQPPWRRHACLVARACQCPWLPACTSGHACTGCDAACVGRVPCSCSRRRCTGWCRRHGRGGRGPGSCWAAGAAVAGGAEGGGVTAAGEQRSCVPRQRGSHWLPVLQACHPQRFVCHSDL